MLTSAIVWRWITRVSLQFTDEASSTPSRPPFASMIGAPEHDMLRL